jgi:hypothetical protein
MGLGIIEVPFVVLSAAKDLDWLKQGFFAENLLRMTTF